MQNTDHNAKRGPMDQYISSKALWSFNSIRGSIKKDAGYPHDSHADNAVYRHDPRADKKCYWHNRNMRCTAEKNQFYLYLQCLFMCNHFMKLTFYMLLTSPRMIDSPYHLIVLIIGHVYRGTYMSQFM